MSEGTMCLSTWYFADAVSKPLLCIVDALAWARGKGVPMLCPDCGVGVAATASYCGNCGLDVRSQWARDLASSTQVLAALGVRVDELTASQRQWEAHRAALRVGAPRVDVSLLGASAPTPVAPEPHGQPIVADAAPVETPQNARPVPAEAASAPEPAAGPYRQPRRLSAASLLGVAGASLLIIAAIVFTAASWSSSGPVARATILAAFAAGFYFLARRAVIAGFPVIAGALAVVSASFCGVAIYAYRYVDGHMGAYSTPVALLVTSLAGYALAQRGLRAVALTSVIALPAAVVALSIELGARIASVGQASVAATAALLGGALLVTAGNTIWAKPLHQAVFLWSGRVFVGAALAVTLLTLANVGGHAGVTAAWLASLMATALLLRAIPLIAAPSLTSGLVWGAIALAAHLAPNGAIVAAVIAVVTLLVVLAARAAPRVFMLLFVARVGAAGKIATERAANAALWGVALPAVGVVTMLAANVIAAGFALFGFAPDGPPGELDSVIWISGANLLLVVAAWLARPLGPWARSRQLANLAVIVSWLALMGAFTQAGLLADAESGGVAGVALAGMVAWWVPRVWPECSRVPKALIVWTWLATGLAAIGRVVLIGADSGPGTWWWAGAILAGTLLALTLASRTHLDAGGLVSALLTGAVAAIVGQLTGEVVYAGLAMTGATVLCLVLAGWWFSASREAFMIGLMPTVPVAIWLAGTVLYLATPVALAGVGAASAATTWSYFALGAVLLIAAPLAARRLEAVEVAGKRAGVSPTASLLAGTGTLVLAEASMAAVVIAEPTLADATGALAAGALLPLGALLLLKPWRGALDAGLWFIPAIALVHGTASLVQLGIDGYGHLAAVGVGVAAAFLAALGLWRQPVALTAAVFLATMAAPVALGRTEQTVALVVSAGLAAGLAWFVVVLKGRRVRAVAWGGVPLGIASVASLLWALWRSARGLDAVWTGQGTGTEWQALLVVLFAFAAVLSLRKVRGRWLPLLAVAWWVSGGLLPSLVVPVVALGFAAVAAAAPGAVLAAVRWQRAYSWPLLVVTAMWWGPGGWKWTAALLGLTVVSLAIAIREGRQSALATWGVRIAPWSLAAAVWCALATLNVSGGIVALLAGATALTVIVIARATSFDADRATTVHLAVATIVFSASMLALNYVGVFLLLAACAFFAQSMWGSRSSRWVALGLLSPAAAAIIGHFGVSAIEAYTAVPALSMIGTGWWWMRRDQSLRSVTGMGPGLLLALMPTCVGLAAYPDPLTRLIALGGAIVVLAVLGIALRWFAFLLAMAISSVYLSVTQLVVAEPVTPRWVAVAFIGGVLLALGFTAEKIRTMR